MEALVIVGHGSHLDPGSDEPVFAHADTIRQVGAFDEVREAFWKEEPPPREVLRTLASDTVYVVPLFMSEGYFTDRVIPRELRLGDGYELDVDKEVRYTPPVGTHDATTDVIVARAASVTGDPSVGPGVGLAVIGHGTDRHDESAASTRYHAERIRSSGRFDEVHALFLDEEPRVDGLVERSDTAEIIAVPLFVADGYHTREDIPAAIGIAPHDGHDGPSEVAGRRLWYAGAVGTEPVMAAAILERAADAGAPVRGAIARVYERVGVTAVSVDA